MLSKVVGLYYGVSEEAAAIIRQLASELSDELNAEKRCEITCEFAGIGALIDSDETRYGDDTVVVVGVPTIKKQVPMQCLHLLQRLHGEGARAIVVTLSKSCCGNSLYDLYAFVDGQGFEVIGAASFIVRGGNSHRSQLERARLHFGRRERPDEADFAAISEFAELCANKIKRLAGCEVTAMQIKAAPLDIEYQKRTPIVDHLRRQDPKWFL